MSDNNPFLEGETEEILHAATIAVNHHPMSAQALVAGIYNLAALADEGVDPSNILTVFKVLRSRVLSAEREIARRDGDNERYVATQENAEQGVLDLHTLNIVWYAPHVGTMQERQQRAKAEAKRLNAECAE